MSAPFSGWIEQDILILRQGQVLIRQGIAQILAQTTLILTALGRVETKENDMVLDLTNLTDTVAKNTTVEKSALALIQGFAAQLAAALNAGTPDAVVAAVEALRTQITSADDELAAAVTANIAANAPAAPPAA